MIAAQTQEDRSSTPIISNRSPTKDRLERIDRFSLQQSSGESECENDNDGYRKNSPGVNLSINTSQSKDRGSIGSNGQSACNNTASANTNATATSCGRTPKFSCPDEEPIILQRSSIASHQRQQQSSKKEESGEIEALGRGGGRKIGGRHRNHRRRPLFSLSSFKFSLLFPAANATRPSQNSGSPIPSTHLSTTNPKTINRNNNDDDDQEDNDRLIVSSSNDSRSTHSLADVNLFLSLVIDFFRSGMPIDIFRQISSTGSTWFLPITMYGGWKAPVLFPSKSLVVSNTQRLQLQRQRRRRSAQRRRERPVSISGLPNQGQTCFLNSVLQSLASLEPFLEYLEGIVQFQEEMEHVSSSSLLTELNTDGNQDAGGYSSLFFLNKNKTRGNSSTQVPTFTKQLLHLLKGINYSEEGTEDDDDIEDELLMEGEHGYGRAPTGFQAFFGHTIGSRRRGRRRRKRLDPKTLLRPIAKHNQQFSSYGMYEQQDAQELFASLMEVIIHDSELDASPSDRRLETVSDGGNETNILSLSDLLLQIGNEQNRFAAESNGDSLSLIVANKSYHIHQEYKHNFPEEKKQDHNECTNNTADITSSPCRDENKRHGQKKRSRTTNGLSSGYPQSNPSNGMKTMRNIMSPITPSPLSGWLGSTLRCSKCKHVRPIQNAPFLDIPLVPTSVPNYLSKAYGATVKPVSPNSSPMPYCSLEECLENFTSVERVQDVECRSCTIQEEIANLEEEAMMLRGVVETTERRINKKMAGNNKNHASKPEPLEQTKYLRDDLFKIEKRLFELKTMDPDEDNIDPSLTSFVREDDNNFLFGPSDQDEKIPIHRCEANKCLLLTRSPSVLCCHIQRRYYDPFTNRMEKCVQFVKFPLFLDLSPYCAYGQKAIIPWVAGSLMKEDTETNQQKLPWDNKHNMNGKIPYRLQSVIEHRGNAYGGHYVSYRRDHAGTWFCISDSRVTPVSWREVQTCQAYMVFYEAM